MRLVTLDRLVNVAILVFAVLYFTGQGWVFGMLAGVAAVYGFGRLLDSLPPDEAETPPAST